MLKIDFGNPAKRFLKKCDIDLYSRLIDRIKDLAVNPFPKDVKRIINRNDKVFRVRIGDYRILYLVLYNQNLLFIADIDKRAKIYD